MVRRELARSGKIIHRETDDEGKNDSNIRQFSGNQEYSLKGMEPCRAWSANLLSVSIVILTVRCVQNYDAFLTRIPRSTSTTASMTPTTTAGAGSSSTSLAIPQTAPAVIPVTAVQISLRPASRYATNQPLSTALWAPCCCTYYIPITG
jgi:hypothetical protein